MEHDILRDILELETKIRLKVDAERTLCTEQIKATRLAIEKERLAAVERLHLERNEALSHAVNETTVQSEERLRDAQNRTEMFLLLTEEQIERLLLEFLPRLIPEGSDDRPDVQG